MIAESNSGAPGPPQAVGSGKRGPRGLVLNKDKT